MMVDQGENFSGALSSVCFAMHTVHTVYIVAIYHYMARLLHLIIILFYT